MWLAQVSFELLGVIESVPDDTQSDRRRVEEKNNGRSIYFWSLHRTKLEKSRDGVFR